MTTAKQKITTCLWFDDQAKEAAERYISLFENSELGKITTYGKEGKEFHGKPEGSVMTVEFSIGNQSFVGLNGGPTFNFNPSVSLFAAGEDKEEIDKLWKELQKEGSVLMELDNYDWSDKYGWLQDRYGLSWQLYLKSEQEGVEQKICPLLFFTGAQRGKAEEAIRNYTSIFKNSKIEGILHYGEENPFANASVQHGQFQLLGQTFMAMDSGVENDFPFSEAISFVVHCDTQEEIDYYWDHLSEGGDEKAQQCGWLKDKFGVSWQITPNILHEMLSSGNKERTERLTREFLQMKKFDIKKLRHAFDPSL